MTTLLKKAIAKVKMLPAEKQDATAEVIMSYVAHVAGIRLSSVQRAEVRRRLGEKKPKIISLKQFDAHLRRLAS